MKEVQTMRTIFTTVLFIIISMLGGSVAVATDKEYEIGNEFVPEIVSIQKIPDISYLDKIIINDDYLWVIGNERIEVDGKREQRGLIIVFDISNPSEPKQLFVHKPKWHVYNAVFVGKYMYLLCSEKNKKAQRIYFNVADISDPISPIFVGRSEPIFTHNAELCVYKDRIIAFEMSSSYGGGVIDKIRVHTIDISDPSKPKEISDRFLDYRGDEAEYLEGYASNIYVRGNMLYAMAGDKVYAFDISDDVKLVAEHKGSITTFKSICLVEEYMDKDSNYIMALGENPEYSFPNENEKEKSKQNVLLMLDHRTESFGSYYPFDNFIVQTNFGTKLPFDAMSLFSKGLLVFISGYEEPETPSSPYIQRSIGKFKMMVVDISYLSFPRFSGLLEMEGICYDFVLNKYYSNYVYTAKITQQGKESSVELVTIRLPRKEGIFKREYVSREKMYPGYKEPEIQPNSLEPFLRDLANKPSGKLTSADFKGIKALDFEDKKFTDLIGIELCEDLEDLNLKANKVTDLSPLSSLKKLKVLDLSWNKVIDLTSLSSLQELEELNLYANEIVDIEPLLDLPKLKKLNISRNKIKDFGPVTRMLNLTDLIMSSSDFFKPPYLGRLENLKVLNLSGDNIYDLGFVYSLPPTLEELNLNGNKIIDISSLSYLKGLKILSLESNNIRDLSPLSELKLLEELYLHRNKKIKSFSPIGDLKNLKKLDLSENYIDDISFLENLTDLEELDVYHINFSPKKISDLSPLVNIKKLKRLDARENEIKDLEHLSGLIELTYINLDENQVKGVNPLKGLEKLEDLRLEKNQIKDINPLSGLKKIKNLNLFGNQIKDVRCLLDSEIYSGCIVSLGGNEIPEEQLDKIRKDVILLPDENEGRGLSGMVTIASCEKYFHEIKGRYTKDPNEFVSSGVLYLSPGQTEVTMDSMIGGYDIALFEINDNGFTIVIKPKENVQGRTFAINEGGFVIEWLGKKDVDLSKLNLDDDDLWKDWPAVPRLGLLM